MPDSLQSLQYSVRPKVLAKYLGTLMLMTAFLTLVPFLASLWLGEFGISKRYLLVLALLIIGSLLSLRMEHPADIQHNEALTISALAFVLIPLIMSYPMMGAGLSFIDAWFEAVSAVTTTGLSTVPRLQDMPATFLFARAWMQWYGGLGIVVLSVAILMKHHIALRRLINPGAESTITTTRIYARRVVFVYLVLSLGGVALLYLLLDDAFLALTHALAAVSTGGFSPNDTSLASFTWQARFGTSLLGLCGAIPFVLYYRLIKGSWRDALGDIEVRALVAIILLVSALLALALVFQSGLLWGDALRHGLLMGISAQTTTGFSSMDMHSLSPAALGLLMIAMLIGGGIGSTAGGFKLLRLLILLRLIQRLLHRASAPAHAVGSTRLSGKALEGDEIEGALLLIILFVLTVLFSWLVFLVYGHDPLNSLFEVVSAVATTGLSSGISSQGLEPALKIVLCVDMTFGRLEILAVLILLYPGTWLGTHKE